MPRTVNCSPTPTSSLAHAPNSSSKHDEASFESPVLFSPTPTHSITVNKWPSPPPPLPQRSPRIRRRHNLHNYMSLAPTNRSCDVRSSVGAPPPDTPTALSKKGFKARSGHGCSFGVRAWTEMEIRCVKGMCGLKVV